MKVKIVELELDKCSLKITDLRMGGIIETTDSTKYIVLIVGGRFDLNRGEIELTPAQYGAVVGEHIEGLEDEEDPVYETFYNLTIESELTDEGFPLLSPSEKVEIHTLGSQEDWSDDNDTEDISEEDKEKLRNEPINITPYGDRTLLQNLLFSVHSHYPDGPGTLIYHEIDLERVCDHMLKELRKAQELAGSDEFMRASLGGQIDIINQMKAFFDHKV